MSSNNKARPKSAEFSHAYGISKNLSDKPFTARLAGFRPEYKDDEAEEDDEDEDEEEDQSQEEEEDNSDNSDDADDQDEEDNSAESDQSDQSDSDSDDSNDVDIDLGYGGDSDDPSGFAVPQLSQNPTISKSL